jgi:hypothetical protein
MHEHRTASIPKIVDYDGAQISLDKFMSETETNAFLVIKDGQLVYENYFNGKDKPSCPNIFGR